MEDCKVEAGDWLAQNLELSKDFTLANCQIHQTAVSMPHQPTKVTRTTSIREPSLIEPTNVTTCPKQVHQLQHNRGWTDHGLKQIRHGKVIGNILVGNIHKTCGTHQNTTVGGGYFKTKEAFTGDRWIQLTYWSTSWLTPLLLKAISHFLLQLWILYFPAWANASENLSLHRQARNKSHFMAQKWLRGKLPTKIPM